LLHDLAHRAALVLKVDDDTVFSALLKREELGSTGVGNGVAIPHVRLEQVKKPFAIMARLKHPIDFDSIDGQPVDLVCLLVHGYPTPRMRWQLARLLRTRVGSRKAFDASRGTE
jgi:PTS system nitrogen regulatory IIA component